CADPTGLVDLADLEVADIKALVAGASVDDLTRLHQGFSRAFDDVVRSGQPRAAFEMALVRLAQRPPLLPLDELVRKVADLERRLGGSSSGSAPAVPGGVAGPARSGSAGGVRDGGGRAVSALQAPEQRGNPISPRPEVATFVAPAATGAASDCAPTLAV